MARGNGKTEIHPDQLNATHELETGEERESSTPAELSAARAELQRLKAERDTLVERMARLQAEFENARKRADKEQQDFKEFALADSLKMLLPILDSFERALQASAQNGTEFRSGVELINKQLHDAMTKLGVRPIAAKGEPFDPYLHQAVEMVDTNAEKDNHVVEELQRGYKLKDRLLRPVMVRVARNPKH